uniref:Uncharacterized protein n=1 Tax=Amphimedon queenslandica TaxID=400682 RepID=A0A1X7T327_AMPQE
MTSCAPTIDVVGLIHVLLGLLPTPWLWLQAGSQGVALAKFQTSSLLITGEAGGGSGPLGGCGGGPPSPSTEGGGPSSTSGRAGGGGPPHC